MNERKELRRERRKPNGSSAQSGSDAAAGDDYNVTGEKGQNDAMTTEGTWDALGEVFTIDAMDNKEIDKIMGVASV